MWKVLFTHEAIDDLNVLDAVMYTRVTEKIMWLGDNLDFISPIPLTADWRGFFKLRVGDIRIIYEVREEKKDIVIHCIDRRDKIYKRR